MWMEDEIKNGPMEPFYCSDEGQNSVKEHAEGDYSQGFVANTCWLKKFKKRFKIHNVRMSGEAASKFFEN